MRIFLVLLLTASFLCGGTVDFRGGKVLCAELSTTAPSGMKQIKAPVFQDLPADAAFASLTFLPDEDRSISIHDYAITIFGKNYHCIALQKDGSTISLASSAGKNWKHIETPAFGSKKRYTLIFMLDRKEVVVKEGEYEKLTVKPLFHSASTVEERVNFKYIGPKAFTSPKKIPFSGLMPEKK